MLEPVTMEQVRAQLDPDEPDYTQAARLGPGAMPFLLQLVEGDDPMLASKAAYLASLIQSDAALDVVRAAARSPEDIVRVAAAGGLRNLEPPPPLVERLLRDEDSSVRVTTLRSIAGHLSSTLRDDVERVATSDPVPEVREFAKHILSKAS